MKILFITLVDIKDLSDRNIYTDLMRQFVKNGHHVTIVSPIERRFKQNTYIVEKSDHTLLRPKVLNTQKINFSEKVISLLTIDRLILQSIKKRLKNKVFDLLIYSTPPITLTKTISYLKTKHNLFTYLLLKDIFPQNAVDLALFKRGGIMWIYFSGIEKKLYSLSDKIGCMSQANVDFLMTNHKNIEAGKVEICPNSIEIKSNLNVSKEPNFHELNSIPDHSKVLIYGGNLGKPQGVDFLLKLLEHYINNSNVYFFLIGNGTEYSKLEQWISSYNPSNVKLMSYLPKDEYNYWVRNSDIGLIFLDSRFTIPNYPSRLLTYLEYKKPVLAFTDSISDIGTNAKYRAYGDWNLSNDLNGSVNLINEYCNLDEEDLIKKGENGFQFLVNNYTSYDSYNIIIQSYLQKNIDEIT